MVQVMERALQHIFLIKSFCIHSKKKHIESERVKEEEGGGRGGRSEVEMDGGREGEAKCSICP